MVKTNLIKLCMENTLRMPARYKSLIEISASRGVEEIFYPYFNMELSRSLAIQGVTDEIEGIGSGRPCLEVKNQIDCLIILKNGCVIAIELKGPSRKGPLLSGAESQKGSLSSSNTKFTKDVKGLRKCLEKEYGGAVYYDSKIGDIIKILNLIKGKSICRGYSIGLLKYTKRSQCQKQLYRDKLEAMTSCIRPYAVKENLTIDDIEYKDIEDLNVLMSIVEVRR